MLFRSGLTRLLNELPPHLGMHIISPPVLVEVGEKNRKDPGGLSGFVLIAESHFSFHTFPKRRFLTLDLYTCQSNLDVASITEIIKSHFLCDQVEINLIPRGTRYPSGNFD